MKTLKKILSVVLVVAMLASMLIVGAAAAETEKTNYEEAAAVVIGIGIIEGDGTGYNYQKGVTREEAAKIISYMLLGKETADALKTSTAPFADVAATRWSAPFISYLKGQGIISGVSDTEFDPTAPVSAVAFAKMLLVAAGYGANGEFEGAQWLINTITFAQQNDIFEGTLAADLEAGATREEAMLYAFNLLTKVPTVKYNKTFESYYTGKSALDPVDTSDFNPADETTSYGYTLGWTKYELKQSTGGHDSFGRPCMSWDADGVVVAEEVALSVPDAIAYGAVDGGEIYDALGKSVADSLNKADITGSTITVWVDGDPSAITVDPLTNPIKAGYTTNDLFVNSGNGATVEFYYDYADGAYTVDVVVWYEHIATVQKVNKSSNNIRLDNGIVVSGEDFDISGYAKDDVVIYTFGTNNANDTVASIREATPVVGTYINHTLFTYNIDGAFINASEVAGALPALSDKNTQFEFYYDAQGNLLLAGDYDAAAAAGTYNYVYVQKIESQYKNNKLIGGAESEIKLEVVYAEGGKEVVNYQIKTEADGDEYITFNGAKVAVEKGSETNENGTKTIKAISGLTANAWYSFTENEAGEVTLKDLSANNYATAETYINVETGLASTGTAFTANSKTVLTVIDENGIAATYTGIANFPEKDDLKGAYAVLVTHAKTGVAGDEVAKSIVVYVADEPINGVKDYVYVIMPWSWDDEDIVFWAYQDGAQTFIPVKRDNVVGGAPGYEEYIFSTVCELDVESGEYIITAATTAQNGANTSDANTGDTLWFETATIDTVDEGYFKTVEVVAPAGFVAGLESPLTETQYYYNGMVFEMNDPADYTDDAPAADAVQDAYAEYLETLTANSELMAEEGYIMTEPAEAVIYYYDANTVIYDAVNGGFVEELSEGDNFIAIYDEDNLCEYIWIVG